MKATDLLNLLDSGQKDFSGINIPEEVVIENIFHDRDQRSKSGVLTFYDAQIKSLHILDDIDKLVLRKTDVVSLRVRKAFSLDIGDSNIEVLDLRECRIENLTFSKTVIGELLYSGLQTGEVICGDNLTIALLLRMNGHKVVVNQKVIDELISAIRAL